MQRLQEHVVKIRRVDEDKRVVLGEVYPPDTLDTYGEFMTAEDIELMAHRFAEVWREAIDTNHDNIPNGSYPVESFIARDGDPDFVPGAWVLGVKVPDDHIWAQVKKGELNGFSFEALVRPVDVVIRTTIIRDRVGETEPGGRDGHTHLFFLQLDDMGRVVRGETSVINGHRHAITNGSVTGRGGDDRHTHRFFLG